MVWSKLGKVRETETHQSIEKGNSTEWGKTRGYDIVTVKHKFYNMCMLDDTRE